MIVSIAQDGKIAAGAGQVVDLGRGWREKRWG